jgi:hypothetical protein
MLREGILLGMMLLSGSAWAEPDVSTLYDVSTAGSTTRLTAGEKGHLMIALVAKSGAHVSDEAPLRIELSSRVATFEKEKLSLADSLSKKPAEGSEYPDPRFDIGFTPKPGAKGNLEAKLTFFICTEKICARQSKLLTVPIEVH